MENSITHILPINHRVSSSRHSYDPCKNQSGSCYKELIGYFLYDPQEYDPQGFLKAYK